VQGLTLEVAVIETDLWWRAATENVSDQLDRVADVGHTVAVGVGAKYPRCRWIAALEDFSAKIENILR
jgi:hypothetical protein